MTIIEDALRRDFTINTVSVRLSDGAYFAPPHATEDIRDGRIRVVSSSAFIEDPLRMLRAVQFASRFEFHIDYDTYTAIRHSAHLLRTVSAERIGEELTKLLMKSRRPSIGLSLLWKCLLLELTVPELRPTIGQAQNRHHAHDVWGHLLASVDHSAEHDGDLIDRLAALFHDIAKPQTAREKSDGEFTFYNHEVLGAALVGPILARLRFSSDVQQQVAQLVRNHMYPTCTSTGEAFPDRTIRRFIRAVGPDLVERQFRLREADRFGSGRDPRDRAAENTAFEARVRGILRAMPPLDRKTLAIDGSDVISAMIETGLRPAGFSGDPEVGRRLDDLLELVLDDPGRNERWGLLVTLRHMLRDDTDVLHGAGSPV